MISLDFMLDKYRELCEAAVNSQYVLLTVGAYFTIQNPPRKCIVLRHDVERNLVKAVRMAEIEKKLGIKATYYFRFNKKVFQPPVIREIADMGHEIGYHYETLDKARGDYARAIQMFEHELAEFRKIAEVKTICMHGNPLTKWDNRDLWTRYDFRDFGLIGEAYLSFNDISYLSDTGRTWGVKHKVKDYLPSASNDSQSAEKITATSTDDIIGMLKGGRLGHAYLLVHPERWSSNTMEWIASLVSDISVNLAKRILALRATWASRRRAIMTYLKNDRTNL